MKQIILASGSPRRRELMAQIGLAIEVIPSHKEEVVTEDTPERIVKALSNQKAEDIWTQNPDRHATCVVIGADTIVVRDGEVLGKPKDEADAIHMLHSLQGRSHQVYTGVTIYFLDEEGAPQSYSFAVETDVNVYPMTDEEIRAYVDSKDPMDKAGAYGIQGAFAAYIRSITGEYNNVVGLPVGRLYQELKAFDLI